jgi:hypothetical protein
VFAVAPLGADEIGADNAILLGFTAGLLITFLLVRINTRLVRANVSWWFRDIERGGTHIHHMVFGVVIMVASGLLTFALTPTGLALQFLAFAFGAGVALTLDEFALILHLDDVYRGGRDASRSTPSSSRRRQASSSCSSAPRS